MIIDFNAMQEYTVVGMNGGMGEIATKMYVGRGGKIIPSRLAKGSSIGLHTHTTSDDINYVISGTGRAICDGEEELLSAGVCHVCKKGLSHSIVNTGDDDLILLTVVVER